MLLICEHCHYEFERVAKTAQCPDCGKKDRIRTATEEETKAFQCRRAEDVWSEPVPARVG